MQDRKIIAISEIVKIIEECRYNDELAEGFATEEIARFDIAWPEEPKEELNASTEEKEEIKISTD